MSIKFSCGCWGEEGDEGTFVMLATEECDAIDGFYPTVAYHHVCKYCAEEWKTWPDYLPDKEAVNAFWRSKGKDFECMLEDD